MNALELQNTLDELYKRDLISQKQFYSACEQTDDIVEKVNIQTENDKQNNGT